MKSVATDGSLTGQVTRDRRRRHHRRRQRPGSLRRDSRCNVDYCETPADDDHLPAGPATARIGCRSRPDDDGTWDADELQEGYHLVTVDLPSQRIGSTARRPGDNGGPLSQYFVEVDGQSERPRGLPPRRWRARRLRWRRKRTTLDFHLVPSDDGGDRNPIVRRARPLLQLHPPGPLWNEPDQLAVRQAGTANGTGSSTDRRRERRGTGASTETA